MGVWWTLVSVAWTWQVLLLMVSSHSDVLFSVVLVVTHKVNNKDYCYPSMVIQNMAGVQVDIMWTYLP